MAYSPEIREKDRKILEVIARGHPSRTLKFTGRGRSVAVPALTSDEIEVAAHARFGDVSDSIARLISNDYIEGGRQPPSILGKLRGNSETYYFWITQAGLAFLKRRQEEDAFCFTETEAKNGGVPYELDQVEAYLAELGFKITRNGIGAALLSINSGYSTCETASYLALAALAQEAREAGDNIVKLSRLVPKAHSMLQKLANFRKRGLMREDLFKNDSRAILGVVMVQKGQEEWISRVLSDPVIAKDKVAVQSNM